MDDIIIIVFDMNGIQTIKNTLHTLFHMKDLVHLQYFLGLEVHTSEGGIFSISINMLKT